MRTSLRQSPGTQTVPCARAIAVLAILVTAMSSCASRPSTPGSSSSPSKINPTPSTSDATSPTPGEGSGEVRGVVVASPSCAAEPLGSPCPAYPVKGAAVAAFSGEHRVAGTTTDGSGRFTLKLPYGSYVVTATNPGGYSSKTSTNVDVATPLTKITLTVDSGIR